MKHLMRVLPIILLALFVLIPATSQSQNLSEYTLTSDGTIMTFIPRPDIGYVVQSYEQDTATQAFQGMLSAVETVESRKIKGLNKRNLTVVMNLDDSINSAFTILQSLNQSVYKAPLFSVNGQTIAIIPEIIVRLASENAYEYLQSTCDTLNLTIKQKLELSQKEYLLEVHGLDTQSVFNSIDKLNQELFIEWAFPNIASQPILAGYSSEEGSIPDDEYFSNLWHLYNTGQTGGTPGADINVTDAWKITTGDPNIVIAIIDTGVDTNHPDLINNLVEGYDFFENDNNPLPDLEEPGAAHGTMCAGLAAAQGNNSIGVCGVTQNCKIMPIRIADYYDFVSDADLATSFRWAAENGADILSNSWGSSYPSPTIKSAIRDVTTQGGIGRNGKGCIVCFAAGNWEDGGPVMYPASYPEVIAVGATDHDDLAWYYSASGPELDIVAPSGAGTRTDYFFLGKPYLWTTDITGIYGYGIENIDTTILDYSDSMNGTSGACPIVAGVAALILSAEPNLTNIQVRNILLDSAHDLGTPGRDDYYGFGRVDANSAVTMALNPPEIPTSSDITLYVDDNAPNDPCAGNPDFSDPNEDGTSQHPFDSIQEAIDYSLSTETIIVLPGTYTGNGNRNIDFLGKNVKLQSESGPETCIIDCQYAGQGLTLQNGETQDTLIEGFTIINAKAYIGAGIYCINDSSPTISNCIIRNCFAFMWGTSEESGEGGGLYLESGSDIILNDCIFENNLASLIGGGICNYYANLTCNNCSFINNGTGEIGGAIFNLFSSSTTLNNCIFTGNYADYEGGALYIEESYVAITNCTFASNSSFYGTAIACDYYYSWWSYGSDIEITNSIIWDGTYSIENYDGSIITVSYSDIPSTGISNWQGTGNINIDPEFADPDNSDYHLKSEAGRWNPQSQTWINDDTTSPCIDTGNPSSDIGNEPESNGGRINMGFYGGTSEASKSSGETPEPVDNTKASNPYPADNDYLSDMYATLVWTAGTNALKHDIYLGTDINAIQNASRDNPMGVLKSQAQINTSYYAGLLNNYTIYYWRIDEILADDTIIKGDVWTFIVYAESKDRGCFTAETPVWIDGQMVEISKVVAGQIAGKANCTMPISGSVKGLEVHQAGFNRCYEMTLESGNTITIVHSHYFMTVSGQWKKIEELSAGMQLQSMNGPITIKSVVKKEMPFLGVSYNLMLDSSEQYFVGQDGVVALDCSKKTWEILEQARQ
ncbi:MAG: S8 family serine peptidase [Sedimentisphaerales bacterium]|nr:S8 family serine peptidase [Sedimentisphaerales bacterium]